MKQSSDTGFKEALIPVPGITQISLYYCRGETKCGRNFFEINFAIHHSKVDKICRIYLCGSIGFKKLFRSLFLWLTPLFEFIFEETKCGALT